MKKDDSFKIGNYVLETLLKYDISGKTGEKKIINLAGKYGDIVYFHVFQVLSDKYFPPRVAADTWRIVKEHRAELKRQLHRDVGFQVSMMDCFKNDKNLIANPMFCELTNHEYGEERALVDTLTNLYNRKIFDQLFNKELRRAGRFGYSLSVIFIDIDYFKQYNDLNGHAAGDSALREIGKILLSDVREFDNVFRYGGEEFVALCPQADAKAAAAMANRIRRKIGMLALPGLARMPFKKITISAGIAVYPDDGKTAIGLLKYADKAVYAAKASGRNKVSIYARLKNKR